MSLAWIPLGLETLGKWRVFSSQGILPKILENQEILILENWQNTGKVRDILSGRKSKNYGNMMPKFNKKFNLKKYWKWENARKVTEVCQSEKVETMP